MLSALHRTTEAGLSRLHECLVSIILLPVGSESMPKDMKALIQKDPQQLNFLDPLNLPELSHKQLYCDMDLTVVLLMSSKIRPWHSPSTPSRSSGCVSSNSFAAQRDSYTDVGSATGFLVGPRDV